MKHTLTVILVLLPIFFFYGCDSVGEHTHTVPSAESGQPHGAPTKNTTSSPAQ